MRADDRADSSILDLTLRIHMMGLGTNWMRRMMPSTMTHLAVWRALQQSQLGKTLTSLDRLQRSRMP